MYAVTLEMKTSNRTHTRARAPAQITASDHYSIRWERRIDILNKLLIYKTLLKPFAVVKYMDVSSDTTLNFMTVENVNVR